MARIRTIKPEFWRNEGLSSVSAEAALLAVGLLNHADDEGFFCANPKLVEADVFPLRELSSTTTVLLQELADIGYIVLLDGRDGKKYGWIRKFGKHQVVNKKQPSKIKPLCQIPEHYRSDTGELPPGMERNREKEMEKEGEEEKESPAGEQLVVESQNPPPAAPTDKFPMTMDWRPTPSVLAAKCEALGIDIAAIEPGQLHYAVIEFISYWECHSEQRNTHVQWHHKLAHHLKHPATGCLDGATGKINTRVHPTGEQPSSGAWLQ